VDLTRLLGRLATGAPAPVFPVTGTGSRSHVQDLRLAAGIEIVASPRAAVVLLVAGEVPATHVEALGRGPDLMPHPRATVAWRSGGPLAGGWPAVSVDPGEDPVPVLRGVAADLLSGARPSEPPVLPDVEPVEWRGVGPYGQGGSGMTGGTPYGRPMAELGPDRDGLRLDILPVTVGPFVPWLPPGLVLDVKLAGDLVVEAAVAQATSDALSLVPPDPGPFVRALHEPVLVAELEVARARAHLRWLSDALLVQGLPALSRRALRLARSVRPGDGARVRAFAAALPRTGLFRWSLGGTRSLGPNRLAGLGLGPIARAAGLREDARLDDPAYVDLAFEPVVLDLDAVRGPWRVRLEEAARSLDLAARAGLAVTSNRTSVESPRGRLESGSSPTGRLLDLVPDALAGLEWGTAVSTLVSLDLDLDEAALVAPRALEATA